MTSHLRRIAKVVEPFVNAEDAELIAVLKNVKNGVSRLLACSAVTRVMTTAQKKEGAAGQRPWEENETVSYEGIITEGRIVNGVNRRVK